MKTITLWLLGLALFLFAGCTDFIANVQDFDEDRSGTLSAAEISAGLVELADDDGDGHLNQAELHQGFREIRLLERWDLDDDGRVNATDFLFLFPEGGDLENRFAQWDEDGNNVLSYEEVAAQLFTRFDLDHDDILDRGEVERVVVAYGVIADHDVDDDGELSLGEIQNMVLQL